MIIFRPFGGIGNQLFGYCAARRLAIVSQQELVIDDVSGFTYDKKYERKYQLDNFNILSRKATYAERWNHSLGYGGISNGALATVNPLKKGTTLNKRATTLIHEFSI